MAVSFELYSENEQRLKDLARRTGKTPEFHLQELIAQKAAMRRLASGQEAIYSSEQVRKNLGLAD